MKLREVLSESAFWAFSIEFYGLEPNKDTLLRLQEEAELNVNLVLLLLYLSLHNIVLTEPQLNKLLVDISELDSLTSHIRESRKQMKLLFSDKSSSNNASVDNAEYKALLEVELSLEKRQQAQLVSTLKLFDSLTQKGSQESNSADNFVKSMIAIVDGDRLIKASAKKELKKLGLTLQDFKQSKLAKHT